MAKAKKLPSGNWRVLVYIGENQEGKRQYKSFTAETKWEAEALASEFARHRSAAVGKFDMTVGEAITRYINSKESVLSPSTIRSYRTIQKNHLQEIRKVRLKSLSNETIQSQINLESAEHSPKAVANMYGLLTATLKMFYPSFRVVVTLPKKRKREPTLPSDGELKALLQEAQGKDIELPIMLAAMGSLREGEIAALTVADIVSEGVRVNKAMVITPNHKWAIKDSPKTAAGVRVAPLPEAVMKKLCDLAQGKPSDERLFKMTPQSIYRRFKRIREKCGLNDCRFHDLRHYYASTAHLLGVPDQYIMKNGGWSDKSTLTNIYQHALSDHEAEQNQKLQSFLNEHFLAK